MSLDWIIAPKTRCDILAWSGPNFSGYQKLARIFAAGGRQGDDLDGAMLSSCWVVGPLGIRVVFCAAPEADPDWESKAWRAVVIRKGSAFKTKTGLPAVRVPDLDWLDKPNAQRTDPDFQMSFQQVKTLDAGTEWTFGNGNLLKNRIHSIRVDKLKV
jgi:hypothetical protein